MWGVVNHVFGWYALYALRFYRLMVGFMYYRVGCIDFSLSVGLCMYRLHLGCCMYVCVFPW